LKEAQKFNKKTIVILGHLYMPVDQIKNAIEYSYISRFYSNQHYLRGITSEEEVIYWEKSQSKGYDNLVLPHIATIKNAKIVEVACGPGIFLRYLKNKGFVNSFGVEFADGYASLCREQGLKVIQADALLWLKEQPAGSIDAIIAVDFMEHLDKQSFIDFLDSVSAALSLDGRLILRGPCADSPVFGQNYYNDITHETVFTSTALKVIMQLCALETVSITDEFPHNLNNQNIVKSSLIKISRVLLRYLIYAATGCKINNLSPNIWLVAKKKSVE
jgi:2-polyprenyl-3-methyl-5-hydroxy-6-metoxy-1,4-benzoquinol methylase